MPPLTEEARQPARAAMSACSICGTDNAHDAGFCRCCGVSITHSSQFAPSEGNTAICGHCHRPHASPARFCDQCGTRLPGYARAFTGEQEIAAHGSARIAATRLAEDSRVVSTLAVEAANHAERRPSIKEIRRAPPPAAQRPRTGSRIFALLAIGVGAVAVFGAYQMIGTDVADVLDMSDRPSAPVVAAAETVKPVVMVEPAMPQSIAALISTPVPPPTIVTVATEKTLPLPGETLLAMPEPEPGPGQESTQNVLESPSTLSTAPARVRKSPVKASPTAARAVHVNMEIESVVRERPPLPLHEFKSVVQIDPPAK